MPTIATSIHARTSSNESEIALAIRIAAMSPLAQNSVVSSAHFVSS